VGEDSKTPEEVARFLSWFRSSHTDAGADAMINLARTAPGITITRPEFDADPMLFGVQNGVIDLRTGEFREPKRE
jgi:putative DNA primase/helicase